MESDRLMILWLQLVRCKYTTRSRFHFFGAYRLLRYKGL